MFKVGDRVKYIYTEEVEEDETPLIPYGILGKIIEIPEDSISIYVEFEKPVSDRRIWGVCDNEIELIKEKKVNPTFKECFRILENV